MLASDKYELETRVGQLTRIGQNAYINLTERPLAIDRRDGIVTFFLAHKWVLSFDETRLYPEVLAILERGGHE